MFEEFQCLCESAQSELKFEVPKVLEALSERIILLKLIVPKAQTLTLAHFRHFLQSCRRQPNLII
jgi:hypothetical protein